MRTLDKQTAFSDLVRRVKACDLCPRMKGSARVLSAGCGPLSAKLMFIGEAPGRLGADASELPFHGDRSGHNFEALLEQVGLSRYDVFVTNAVLCNPKDERGNNSTPTSTELANCSRFLKEQIALVNSAIVVTLGATSLKATSLIDPHDLTLKNAVRTASEWTNRKLLPIYHPGQRAMVHRSFANQLADYQFIAETFRRLGSKRKPRGSKSTSGRAGKVAAVARVFLQQNGELSYFALHKLLFLAEVRHLESASDRLTNGYFVRQKDGPYCVELHASRIRTFIPECLSKVIRGDLFFSIDPLLFSSSTSPTLSASEIQTISDISRKYAKLSHSELKTVTYLTRPMRQLLLRERRYGMNLFNAPILPPPKSKA